MSASGVQWWCSARGGIWTWRWQPYPGIWLFVAATAAGLALRWRGRLRIRRAAAGVALLWLGLDWPLGPLGAGYLEFAHMLQFLLLVLAAPPLILSAPPRAAPGSRPSALPRALARPWIALPVSAALIVAGHTPAVVDALMSSQLGALALDLLWLAAGFTFWWPVVSPHAGQRPARGPLTLIYLWAATVAPTGIGVWLMLAHWPQYRTYELAPPVSGISALADQQMAGGLMLTAGFILMTGAVAAVVPRWMREADNSPPPSPAASAGER